MEDFVPWVPRLGGRTLIDTRGYQLAKKYNTTPEDKTLPDIGWCRTSQLGDLRSVTGAARESLHEVVLHLWRLKEEEEAENSDPSWRDLVEAWLVRRESS